MINKIIHFAIYRPATIALMLVVWIVAGIYSYRQLAIDAVPDITNNQVQIVTTTTQYTTQEVEQFITMPLELNLANLPEIEELRSISRSGLSLITVVFKENADLMKARQLISEQIQRARAQLPKGIEGPELMPITTGLGEVYQYVLNVSPEFKSRYDAMQLRTINDWIVKRKLAGIEGVIEISSFGGFVKQIEVSLDIDVLNSLNLTVIDVYEKVAENLGNTGGSYIEKGESQYYIRAVGNVEDIQSLEQINITGESGSPIKLNRIAKIREGFPPRYGALSMDGKGEAVGGITLMLKGSNALATVEKIKNRVANINQSLPEGITIEPYLERSHFISRVIDTVAKNLIEGGLIVIFVLVLFLGNFRAGLIVASVIPLALLFAFTLMHFFGVTANLMSLGAIDFGIVVDGSVIIVEAMLHEMHKHRSGLHTTKKELLYNSATQIRSSAAFGEIIILIVYVPILFLQGIEGKMFKPMAFTVGFAILGAFILSLTYVPAMASVFLPEKLSNKLTLADKMMNFISAKYRLLLISIFKFQKLVVSFSILLLLLSGIIFYQSGAVFMPTLDEGDLALQAQFPTGSSLEESVRFTTQIERNILNRFKEVKHVVSKIGTAEVPTDPMAIEDADIMIILKPEHEWPSKKSKETLMDEIVNEIENIVGVNAEITQPIQLRFNELLTGTKADIALKIYGDNTDTLLKTANTIFDQISNIDGVGDIKVDRTLGLPQLQIKYNRNALSVYEVSVADVNQTIVTAFSGMMAGIFPEGDKKFDIVVRLDPDQKKSENIFQQLKVRSKSNKLIPVSQLAEIEFVPSPLQVSRENAQRLINIGINVRGRDVKSLVEEISKKVKSQKLVPSGYSVHYGGQFENLASATSRLSWAVPAALLLILVLLYFTFNSVQYSLLIFSAIPLAGIGGVFALYIRELPFSISAAVGFIALFGVAVLNGIVLIARINTLRARHTSIIKAVLNGTQDRIRPVLITAMVASLGFLPMALSNGAGAEVQRPLATVVIGGLISSTALTLFLLPILYLWLHGFSIKKLKNKSLLIGLFLLPGLLQAQNQKLTLSDLLQLAERQNVSLQIAKLQKEASLQASKSKFDLGTTDINYDYGQINSSFKTDFNFSVLQNFGSPQEKLARAKQINEMIEWAETNELRQKQVIASSVKSLFFELAELDKLDQKLSLILPKIQQLEEAFEKAEKLGELSKTDILTFKNLTFKIKIADLQLKEKYVMLYSQMQQLLQTKDSLIFNFDLSFAIDEEKIKPNFEQFFTKQIAMKKAEYIVLMQQKSTRFSVGFFNQQIDGIRPLQGFKFSVSLPLFFNTYLSNIQVSKRQMQILDYQFNEIQLQRNLKIKELENKISRTKNILQQYHSKMSDFSSNSESLFQVFTKGNINIFQLGLHLQNILEIEIQKTDITLQLIQSQTELEIYQ
jgi:cobalt-zinc-cadmium resistance protein CzcA